jgi:hypothetical protein
MPGGRSLTSLLLIGHRTMIEVKWLVRNVRSGSGRQLKPVPKVLS